MKNGQLQEIDADALATARAAFERLRQGEITGEWQPFVSMKINQIKRSYEYGK